MSSRRSDLLPSSMMSTAAAGASQDGGLATMTPILSRRLFISRGCLSLSTIKTIRSIAALDIYRFGGGTTIRISLSRLFTSRGRPSPSMTRTIPVIAAFNGSLATKATRIIRGRSHSGSHHHTMSLRDRGARSSGREPPIQISSSRRFMGCGSLGTRHLKRRYLGRRFGGADTMILT